MASSSRPFRFYDNRQKYLAFVTACNEKSKIAQRAAQELTYVRPTPPSVRLFDAGMGDGTLLSHVMQATHQQFPTVPLYVVGKEISLEDIRLSLEKLPDRFVEHPASVVVFTNLYYAEAPWLRVNEPRKQTDINWLDVPLTGQTAHAFGDQLRGLDPELVEGWKVVAGKKTGNPLYAKPSVLVLYREDHKFLLDAVIPRPDTHQADYDLTLVSQPWRASMSAEFKVNRVLAPMVEGLAPSGRALVAQSCGNDPGLELVREVWPDADPFKVSRHDLITTLRDYLGPRLSEFKIQGISDADSILSYEMHTLPDEIQSMIGTSTLFAAWNAAIYVAQIEDEKLESVLTTGAYLECTARILQKHRGLWFNDETFVISRSA